MIEPKKISLPTSTPYWDTVGTEENGRAVCYSAGFGDLSYYVDGDRLRITGRPAIWKSVQVPKLIPFFSREKRKWVRKWMIDGESASTFTLITLFSRYKSDDDVRQEIINMALKAGFVFDAAFVSTAFARAFESIRGFNREFAPIVVGEKRIQAVA